MDTPAQDHPLAARVARLEREIRLMKRIGGVVFGAAALVGLTAQFGPPPRVLEAERFVLRSARGPVLGAFELGALGQPQLRLQTRDSAVSATLGVDGITGSTLRLDSDHGGSVLELDAATGTGTYATLRLRGRHREGWAELSWRPDAIGAVAALSLSSGEKSPGLTMATDDSGALVLSPYGALGGHKIIPVR